MNLNEYQTEAAKTVVFPSKHALIYPAVGLAEEAGEVAGQIKRILRDDDGQLSQSRREKLFYELGDVMWYVAALATDLGLSLEAIAQGNLSKLRDRQERKRLHGEGSDR